MPTLATLLLATPIWGFALQPPTLLPPTVGAPSFVVEPASLDDAARNDLERGLSADAATERRAEDHNLHMMAWTRGMSAASIVAFAAAGVLGWVQLADEYGFHDEYSQTACASGGAVLGYCDDATPWPHLIAVGATAGLGLTTFVLSTQVDYERAARRDGDWRIYEITRWVGLGLFVAQGLGGFLLANAIRFGWADPQADFDTMQGFAVAHMALGTATLGLEVYNTAIMF
jgi:hypothetical protein